MNEILTVSTLSVPNHKGGSDTIDVALGEWGGWHCIARARTLQLGFNGKLLASYKVREWRKGGVSFFTIEHAPTEQMPRPAPGDLAERVLRALGMPSKEEIDALALAAGGEVFLKIDRGGLALYMQRTYLLGMSNADLAALTKLLCRLPSASIRVEGEIVVVEGVRYGSAAAALAAHTPAKKARRAAAKPAAAAPAAPAVVETLAAFAARVLATAAAAPSSHRFGDRKVFLALFSAADKARMVEAHRAGLVRLSRADLVECMPAALVAESYVGWSGSEFHFVIDASVQGW